ncbi:D-2-hydroxyacid dehydrogenase [Tistrella mobilis]|jgi:glycerate dehydrogenase|uniref:D-2-hydroxyacid dehydrogenase n=1 Tax=Tistrella mobilis TaxID=171437 RepID=UPI0035569742
MTSPRLVFLDRGTLSPGTRLRRPAFDHDVVVHDRTAPDQVAGRIAGASIVITNKVRIGADALDAAPGLRLIAVAATGTDVIDLAACTARGITVCNIRDYARHTVPEHTFALIFALRRSLLAYADAVRAGRWQAAGQFCFFDHPIRDLAGSRLGIIGDGALGRAVGRIGAALGLDVVFAAHKGRSVAGAQGMGPLYTDFDRVLETADILTLHAPLIEPGPHGPGTRHMIGRPEFARMARRPLLINTARGGLVDETALVEALEAGQISGAGFDVATAEPPAPDHPLMRIAGRPDVIITPHIAWAAEEAIQTLADQLIDLIEAFMAGRPRNVVAGPGAGS